MKKIFAIVFLYICVLAILASQAQTIQDQAWTIDVQNELIVDLQDEIMQLYNQTPAGVEGVNLDNQYRAELLDACLRAAGDWVPSVEGNFIRCELR